MSKNNPVNSIKKSLNLSPHPEGGYYRQTFLDQKENCDGRSISSIIYFLLEYDNHSHWHRIDATEAWFWHKGAPLALTISPDGCSATSVHLGSDIFSNQKPHFVVPSNVWQTAETLGEWTLVSCMVSPSFSFDTFELAPEDWRPDIS